MTNTSTLQQQYPLNVRRKFWKKILSNILGYFILNIFIGPLLGVGLALLVFGSSTDSLALFISFPIGGFIITFGLTILVYSLYVKWYIKTYYYSADKDFITIKKGVFAPTEIHVQYQKIQDVYVDQDILDRILGIYDVHIASATVSSGIEAHIDGVNKDSAEGLKNLLLESIKNKGNFSQNNTGNAAAPIQEPTAQTPAKINFSEKISTETYPILGRWMYAKILGIILWSFVISFFIIITIFVPEENNSTSLGESLGFNTDIPHIFFYSIIIAIIFSLFRIVYLIVWKHNFKFEFTPEYIFTYQGFISTEEKHVPYNTIQDVIMNQGVIDRLLGLYNVFIQNAANNGIILDQRRAKGLNTFSGIVIPGQSFERASKLTEVLKSTVLSKNSSTTGL